MKQYSKREDDSLRRQALTKLPDSIPDKQYYVSTRPYTCLLCGNEVTAKEVHLHISQRGRFK